MELHDFIDFYDLDELNADISKLSIFLLRYTDMENYDEMPNHAETLNRAMLLVDAVKKEHKKLIPALRQNVNKEQ